METLKIEVLNPKAKSLLNDLADLKLIKIRRDRVKSDFADLLKKLRKNSAKAPSFDEITTEVEAVRKARYEKL
jgi:hypothetical protein